MTYRYTVAGIALYLASSVLPDAVFAQSPEDFQQKLSQVENDQQRQSLCETAYDMYFAPSFGKPTEPPIPEKLLPENLMPLWKACDGFLLPSNAAMAMTRMARRNFNAAFSDTAQWTVSRYLGMVSNTEEAAGRMFDSAISVNSEISEGQPNALLTPKDASEIRQSAMATQTISTQIKPGDLLIEADLQDRRSNQTYKSINSISPDGGRFSGYFFLATRLEGPASKPAPEFNTSCIEEVNYYVFGIEADRFKGCVRTQCIAAEASDCIVSTTDCTGGFMGECKMLPEAVTAGQIVQPSCRSGIKYMWVTGLKSISVQVDNVTLNVKGTFGQSGKGSMLAEVSCPVPSALPKMETIRLDADVLFDHDSFVLKNDAKQEIDRNLESHRWVPQDIGYVDVNGHTDDRGEALYNEFLSVHRAEAVRSYLIDKGIAPDIIRAQGFGETSPVASNSSDSGRAQNRRVEIVMYHKASEEAP
ncbi:OmpA family protein [Dongia soli]|uniref:OmpA family protein n=1 Tax=Dongia soli TaxID=600628 RepID=A0ABU5EG52_9PROT|nr:OmpA family protein [Dongia soli]MDY0885207.1 OmpA family protein [Dongia soli]